VKLDRNINGDGRGKYALIQMRNVVRLTHQPWSNSLVLIGERDRGPIVEMGGVGSESEFFVIKLKDKYAAAALGAYAMAAHADDPEYALEILNMAKRAAERADKKMPD